MLPAGSVCVRSAIELGADGDNPAQSAVLILYRGG
jgi:hypothetical protein